MKLAYALVCGSLLFGASALASGTPPAVPATPSASLPKQIQPAKQEEAQDVDGVITMQQDYKKQFPELPPSRNCLPQDVEGWWVQTFLLQTQDDEATRIYGKEGPEYLLFGSYNRFVQQRSHMNINVSEMQKQAEENKKQYIVSVKGTLYIYENYVLKTSLLCFVSTEKTDKYKEGLLLLAEPSTYGKPMVVSIYEQMAGRVKKE